MKKRAAFFLGKTFFEKLYCEEDRRKFSTIFDVFPVVLTPENWREHADKAADVQVFLSGWGMAHLDEELLRHFPELEAVFYAGGSLKGLVGDPFWDSGVVISSAVAANAVPVAEFTVAQIVLAAKHTWKMAADVNRLRSHALRHEPPGMFGITVGLISLGAIGKMVAEKLRAFDVSIIACDPTVSSAVAEDLNVKLVGLEEVFSRAEIVSCHAPLLDSTRGMLKRHHFEQMKPGATFINTARGGLVRNEDLVAVFGRRPDLTAILDVTDPEPPELDSPLYDMPNIILTPHIAGSMGHECFRMGHYMLEEARRFLAGIPLRCQVTRSRFLLTA